MIIFENLKNVNINKHEDADIQLYIKTVVKRTVIEEVVEDIDILINEYFEFLKNNNEQKPKTLPFWYSVVILKEKFGIPEALILKWVDSKHPTVAKNIDVLIEKIIDNKVVFDIIASKNLTDDPDDRIIDIRTGGVSYNDVITIGFQSHSTAHSIERPKNIIELLISAWDSTTDSCTIPTNNNQDKKVAEAVDEIVDILCSIVTQRI